MSAIHAKTENNKMTDIKKLIHEGVDISERDCFGRTPLHIAANHGNIQLIEFLVNLGANLNAIDNGGNTPLLQIDCFDNTVVKILLEYGANPNIENADGRTVLDLAYESNATDSAELLLKYGATSTIKPSDYGDYDKNEF